jgi:hypothetical protein
MKTSSEVVWWMCARRFAQTIIIVSAVAVWVGNTSGQSAIAVGPNVQVSSARPDWEHNEVILAADPNDARRLLAASMFLDPSKGGYSVATYVSFDGGRSWQSSLIVGRELGHYGDPATAFGCKGTAFSLSLKSLGPRYQWQTLVHRSDDGGKTWLPPTVLPYIDREYITVDCTNSKYRGRIYIHGGTVMQAVDGERISGTKIFDSEDEGKNFFERTFVPVARHLNTYQGNGVVLSDGTYIAPFTDLDRDESQLPLLSVIQSSDGVNSFSTAIAVAKRTAPPRGQMGPVSFSVDKSAGPFQDRIYAVWTDGRSGRSEILLAYSGDKGTTWSEPIVVNDDQPFADGRKGPDDFQGVVAVNQAGVVGVTWYDRRESTNNRDWWVRFAASFDGGNSFSRSVKVSEAAFSHDKLKIPSVVELSSVGGGDYESPSKHLSINVRQSRSYFTGGDTAGLAASADGVFHALWIDNRTGVPQVWTAPITVVGRAASGGTHGFENLEDLTKRMIFQFSEGQYDSLTKTFSLRAHLVNTSAETLAGPMVVRVLAVGPKEAEILNSDNKKRGKDAVWEYTSLLKDNRLEPGKRTEGKLIQLRINEKEGNQTLQKDSAWVFPSLSVEVFGKLATRSLRR